ncbi:MAG: hypothetical protein M3336_16895 [Chloroflexota bacterium]|nr:hypothetical protein [Chloroflexota bacterium]
MLANAPHQALGTGSIRVLGALTTTCPWLGSRRRGDDGRLLFWDGG